MTPNGAVAARLRGVERAFALPTGNVVALRGIDLDVAAHGVTVVSGPSGCGKTTLLNLVTGTHALDAGTIEVLGRDLARCSPGRLRRMRRAALGIMLARPSDNLVERLDVAANVRLAARLRSVPPDIGSAVAALALELPARARIAQLSGGEQQRLAIAIAFLGDPRLVVLDEPTAELDGRTARAVVDYLRSRATERAVLIASHDPAVLDAADEIVILDRGRRVA